MAQKAQKISRENSQAKHRLSLALIAGGLVWVAVADWIIITRVYTDTPWRIFSLYPTLGVLAISIGITHLVFPRYTFSAWIVICGILIMLILLHLMLAEYLYIWLSPYPLFSI